MNSQKKNLKLTKLAMINITFYRFDGFCDCVPLCHTAVVIKGDCERTASTLVVSWKV